MTFRMLPLAPETFLLAKLWVRPVNVSPENTVPEVTVGVAELVVKPL